MYTLSGQLENAPADSEASFHLYGQAAAQNRDLPAADLFRILIDEAAEVFEKQSNNP